MVDEGQARGLGSTRRGLLGAVVGAGATLALGAARGRLLARGPGAVALWAADRAGHRVVGLDGRGLVAVEARVMAPVAVLPGGRWPAEVLVVCSPWATRAGPRAMVALDLGGRVVDEEFPAPRCHGAELPRDPRGWRVVVRDPVPEGRAVTRVERLPGPGRRGFRCGLDFVAGPRCAAAGGLWVADAFGGRTVRIEATGRTSVDLDLADVGGADAILTARPGEGGGVWIARGGALVRLDREGRRLPGQGGFHHLVSLCRGRTAGP